MGILFIFTLFGALFFSDNQEFFETIKKERVEGAEWHYVGPKDLDPTAKSIPLQNINPETGNAEGDPYILWKLKKPE